MLSPGANGYAGARKVVWHIKEFSPIYLWSFSVGGYGKSLVMEDESYKLFTLQKVISLLLNKKFWRISVTDIGLTNLEKRETQNN